ncbi:MAG: ABC transporter ATP-binding protein [[Clostridium] scindens]|uniref:Multidrug export ATP-binding/permease protein n=1 Tax=Clostridium scindens (strain ATCC 35704 / DSM 5676 / VPI 13733 / 19) TaxID=411468 RepID=B0NBI8_CLOS5|nr:ABC transporter ATP-binding protein [[Clostridium] scindens]EDS07924.1 ABC transporter, ATP-binding protein [[Clostridium] scindens ATCC 35704]MCB6893491.1 ABC transporter ATP-binding protein/permease [[Clostridium] scindens]QBF73504.1 Putative multidrug export ATP-binding/permease protein [[Clostridium] scindens ATCC 35704]QRO36822.1 ABC transporter ATP-binding protein [[Clostridium] scindens]WPB31691.1 Putative multidrug export ATP-binding/permease protein [[Clostridium] scindens]
MIKKLQKKYALSEQGAKDLIKGCLACVLQNLSFMFPVGLLYYMVGDLMNGGVPSEKIPFYVAGCVVCIGLILLTTFFQYNATYFATYKESGIRRITLAEHLRKIPLSFFGKKDLADLTSTIMADCTFLEQSFSHFIPELAGSIISTVLISIGLLFTDWRMALAALWVLPVAFAIVGFSAKIQENLNQKAMDVKMACADGIQECIETVRDLKANNAEQAYLKGLEKKIRAVEHRSILNEFGLAAFVVSASLVLKLGIATVALVGAVLLMQGSLSVLTFFMFLLVVSRLYDPLQGALQNLAAVISTRTNIARMNEILDHPIQQGSDRLSNQGYDIVFDHVGFAYNTGETVLKDVFFTAKQGEVTALVGPSGGGKTTVSRLAARFWDINRGKITVGGMDVSRIDPETLLSLYSIVFQDVTLFDNTILENIRIGNKDATDEQVIAAAKLANVDEFAEKLPDGWHTNIGENGCELSGGERQRISIARAFLKNAPIILLDEATASLDVENETLIQTALSRLIEDKTVLVIAHRMRTVAGADKIVVLSDGTVAEEGSPKDLAEKNGVYAHMVKLQTESQNWKLS